MLEDYTGRIKKNYLLLVTFNSISFNKSLFSHSGCILESPEEIFLKIQVPKINPRPKKSAFLGVRFKWHTF